MARSGNKVTFRINGVSEIQRAFRELPDKLAKKVVRQALRKGLAPIRDEAKTLAPRKSGRLASAIKIRAGRRKRGVIGLVVRVGDKDFGGRPFYGAFREFGDKRQSGTHFLERAFNARKQMAAQIISSLVAAGIEREAKAKR